jgi:hypothetical protein
VNRKQRNLLGKITKKLEDSIDPDAPPAPTWTEVGDQFKKIIPEAKEKHRSDMAAFHLKEAEKYEAKAADLEAKGKTGAAERARKVAAKSRAKAEGA